MNTVYLVAFVKALLSLLTNPSKFNQRKYDLCIIGQMRNILSPSSFSLRNTNAICEGLGITPQQFSNIYYFEGGQHFTQARTRARYAVINALRIVTEGKGLLGNYGLLRLALFLLETPNFRYNQARTDSCLWSIYASLKAGVKPVVGNLLSWDVFEIANDLQLSNWGPLYGTHSMPEKLQNRYENAKQQRTKNTIGAIRILTFIVENN